MCDVGRPLGVNHLVALRKVEQPIGTVAHLRAEMPMQANGDVWITLGINPDRLFAIVIKWIVRGVLVASTSHI